MGYVMSFFLIGLPLLSLLWIIVTLIRFWKTDRNNTALRRSRRDSMLFAVSVGGTIILCAAIVFVMLLSALQNM